MWGNPSLSQWSQRCQGRLIGDDVAVESVSTDTRSLTAGDVYVALKGDCFDGHDYLQAAIDKGAAALVTKAAVAGCPLPQLLTDDTVQALGHLAAIVRDHFSGQVVALTGSVGKTSTRAMLRHIFSSQPGLLATEGNFNNAIGVPKTWYRLTARHQRVLLEMGASAQQEIAWLGAFSRPHISLLLNAGTAHVEGFGSLQAVQQGKGEIIDATAADGCVVLNRDDPAFATWLTRAKPRRLLTFGDHRQADVCLTQFRNTGSGSEFKLATPVGDLPVRWAMLGRHMALNAAAAAATALAADIPASAIIAGLGQMRPEPGRLQPLVGNFGGALIHDAYNANPLSLHAAIDVLADLATDTLLIAGDMAELGGDSEQLHRAAGQYARGKIAQLWSVGEHARFIAEAFGGRHFATLDELLAALPARLVATTAVLVKGSRSSGLERVVSALARTS